MAKRSDVSFRRLVVALDAAADCAPAIEIAASVARSLEIGLHAMLVEDENLLRLAALPFAQQVNLATAERTILDPGALRREIELGAAQVRRLLEGIAASHPLAWSFEVRQMAIGPELSGLGQDEVLTLVMASRPATGLARMQSPWRAIVAKLRQPLLLIPEHPPEGGPVAVLHDASAAGERTVETSIRIARAWRRPLTVLVAGEIETAERADLQARLRSEIAGVTLRGIAAPSPNALRNFVRASGVSLVVLSREQISEDGDTESFLGAPPSALLLL